MDILERTWNWTKLNVWPKAKVVLGFILTILALSLARGLRKSFDEDKIKITKEAPKPKPVIDPLSYNEYSLGTTGLKIAAPCDPKKIGTPEGIDKFSDKIDFIETFELGCDSNFLGQINIILFRSGTTYDLQVGMDNSIANIVESSNFDVSPRIQKEILPFGQCMMGDYYIESIHDGDKIRINGRIISCEENLVITMNLSSVNANFESDFLRILESIKMLNHL